MLDSVNGIYQRAGFQLVSEEPSGTTSSARPGDWTCDHMFVVYRGMRPIR
jgi:hypothetical protein